MKHLTYTDRLIIEKLYRQGCSKRIIADTVGVHISTVYRELKRGFVEMHDSFWLTYDSYAAELAQRDYDFKATAKGANLKIGNNHMLARTLEKLVINNKYSPYASIMVLKNIGVNVPISVSTFYSYVDKGVFSDLGYSGLPGTYRKRKYHRIKKAKRAPKGISIDRRPQEITDRNTFNHWEMDCVIGKSKGKGQAILTLTERLTRYEIMVKLKNKDSKSVVSAFDMLCKKYKFDSVTVDNGVEFQDCSGLEHDKGGNKRTTLYYCHPYTSCERGTNERHNRMIRRYIPKGKSIKEISQKEIQTVCNRLNNLPRRILNGQTPAQLFSCYSNL